MNKKIIYIFTCMISLISYIQASNAFDNEYTYYLTGIDDQSPIGTHLQKDDLDVINMQSILIKAVNAHDLNRVKNLLVHSNYMFSDKELEQAFYNAQQQGYKDIAELLIQYIKNRNL